MSDNKKGAGWLITAALLGGVAIAKNSHDKKKEKEAAERKRVQAEKERLERERYENSFEGKANKFFNGLDSMLRNAAYKMDSDYNAAREVAYRRTDEELIDDIKHAPLGKKKAAREELEQRGYKFNNSWE